MTPLQQAAQALVDRWDTPLWKDAEHTGKYIDALRAALSAPPGWQLVPVEPTQEMVRAGWIDKEDTNPDDIWAAMLAAAPSPQEQTNG